MDYEKKYKEALELAKDYFKANQRLGELEENDMLSDIFPELEESEDERIRKALICGMYALKEQHKTCFASIPIDNAIAWLEKQGEQKPVDKVESKFHEGEWVVNNTTLNSCHILKVEHGQYICDDCSFPTTKENEYHLWTIHDAKDGDVIYLPNGNNEYYLFIFKGIENAAVMSFAHFYQYNDGTSVVEGTIDNLYSVNDVFQPATKEQRDLLFQKMYEAGYIFDFEKKKLKKIGFIDEYEGLTDFERTLADICIGWIGKEIGWKQYIKDNTDVLLKIAVKKFNSIQDVPFEQKPTDEEMKELLRTEYEKGRADAIAEMQSPAWSEEDEDAIGMAIIALEDMYDEDAPNTTYGGYNLPFNKAAERLKSLKGRVQPKQEWSEEDIRNIEDIDSILFYNKDLPEDTCMRLRNWLKSLRPQSQWKPSDEQLKALKNAIHLNPFENPSDSILWGLYEQLKKLK